ncbi:MAG: hypothetical protein JNL43_16195 [Flavobacteriales bacterium]|nr:hypothetical protein [Flavobacteriales bacterium]
MWKPTLLNGEELDWISAQALHPERFAIAFANEAVRAVQLNCPSLDFPEADHVYVSELPFTHDYVLACFGTTASREIYGFLHIKERPDGKRHAGDHFHPLDGTDRTLNLMSFLCAQAPPWDPAAIEHDDETVLAYDPTPAQVTPEDDSVPMVPLQLIPIAPPATPLEHLFTAFSDHLRTEEGTTVVLPLEHYRVYLPAVDWQRMDHADEIEQLTREALSAQVEDAEKLILWWAKLPFYRDHRLVEIIDGMDGYYDRSYALVRWTKRHVVITPVRGTLSANSFPDLKTGQLQLKPEDAALYLQFFNWMRRLPAGRIFSTSDRHDLPVLGIAATERGRFEELGVIPQHIAAPMGETTEDIRHADVHLLASVVYQDQFIRTRAAIRTSTGQVTFYQDEILFKRESHVEELLTEEGAADTELAFITHRKVTAPAAAKQPGPAKPATAKPPGWVGPLRGRNDSPWTTPEASLARRIHRVILLNCPAVPEQLDEATIHVQRIDYRRPRANNSEPAEYLVKEYVLVRIADTPGERELYGLLFYDGPDRISDHFHALTGTDEQHALLAFLLDTRQDEHAFAALNDLWTGFIRHLAEHPDRVVLIDKPRRVNLPPLDWSPMDDEVRLALTRQALEPYFAAPARLRMWTAKLPFYRHYHLLELFEHTRRGWRRYYALVKWAADRATIKPLHERFSLQEIHQDDEFHLEEKYATFYLRFFYFLWHGRYGRYHVFTDKHDMPLLGVSETLAKAMDDDLVTQRSYGTEELAPADQQILTTGARHFRLCLTFKGSLFTSQCALDLSNGQSKFYKEKLVLEEDLPVYEETFKARELSFLSINSKRLRPIEHVRQLAHRSLHEDHDLQILPTTAAEFARLLEADGGVMHRAVNGAVLFDPWRNSQCPPGSISRVSVVGCTFMDHVQLGDRGCGPEIEFIDCRFEQGFSGRDADIGSTLTFVHCTFLADDRYALPDAPALHALNLANLRLDGDLVLYDCSIYGGVFAPAMEIKGAFALQGCTIAHSPLPVRLPYKWIDVIEPLYLWEGEYHLHLPGADCIVRSNISVVQLDGSHIGGNLMLTFAGNVLHPQALAIEFLHSEAEFETLRANLVAGHVSASGLKVSGAAEFYGLVCGGSMDLSASSFEGNVDFGGIRSSLPGMRKQGAHCRILGGLGLNHCDIRGRLSLANLDVEGVLDLFGVDVRGYVNLSEARIRQDIDLREAQIGGTIFAERTEVSWNGRDVLFVGDRLIVDGSKMGDLKLEAPVIRGSFRALTGSFGSIKFTRAMARDAEGVWDLRPARVGKLEIREAKVASSIILAGLHTTTAQQRPGSPKRNDPRTPDVVVVRNTSIGGNLIFFERAEKPAPEAFDVQLGPNIGGDKRSLILHDRLQRPALFQREYHSLIGGNVDLQGTSIEGRLDLRNTHLVGKGSLIAHDLSVRQDIDISTAIDDARHYGITSSFHDVDLEKLQCSGDLMLDGLVVRGSFLALGAVVKGAIALAPILRSERYGHTPTRPSEQIAPLPDEVLALATTESPVAVIHGRLDLTGVQTGHLKLPKDTVQDRDRKSRSANGQELARISLQSGTFSKLEIEAPTASIDLGGVKVGRWEFAKDAKPIDNPARRRALRRRWITESLHGPGNGPRLREAELYIDILDPMCPFEQSTWVEVEKSLRNKAKDEDADKIYIAMRKREAKRLRGWSRLASKASWWTTRYGTNLMRPLRLYVPMFALTWYVFTDPRNVEFEWGRGRVLRVEQGAYTDTDPYKPRNATKAVPADGNYLMELDRTQVNTAEPWSIGDGFVMALRYCIPLVELPFHEPWSAGQRELCRWRRAYITVEGFSIFATLLSTITLSVMLLGVTSRMVRGKGDG